MASAEPTFVAVCHCGACKRFTGSAFALFVVYPKSNFEIQGPIKEFASEGDSGKKIVRNFCPECGSGIFEEADSRPGYVLVNGGCFDEPGSLTPTVEAFCDKKLHWVSLDEGLQKFPGMPS
jgi:hypothetical protein